MYLEVIDNDTTMPLEYLPKRFGHYPIINNTCVSWMQSNHTLNKHYLKLKFQKQKETKYDISYISIKKKLSIKIHA